MSLHNGRAAFAVSHSLCTRRGLCSGGSGLGGASSSSTARSLQHGRGLRFALAAAAAVAVVDGVGPSPVLEEDGNAIREEGLNDRVTAHAAVQSSNSALELPFVSCSGSRQTTHLAPLKERCAGALSMTWLILVRI